MRFTQNYYCSISKRLLLFIGQWPYQERKMRLLAISTVLVSVLAINIPQMCKLIHCGEDLLCILATIPSYMLMVMVMVKMFTCQFKQSKIKYLIERMLENWKSLKSPEEYEIMEAYTASGNLIVLLYFTSCLIATFLFIMTSLIPRILDTILPLNETRPILLPYEAYYFVDVREYFYYIFGYSLVTAPISMSAILAHDCMFLVYVQHVCGVFSVAGYRSDHLVCDCTDAKKDSNNPNNKYNRKVESCVHAHWAALEFAEVLENTFSIPLIVQLTIATVVMSITLTQVTIRSDNILEVFRYIMYVVLQLVHLFLFSWQGQRLIDHSLQMRDRIYNCHWYKIPAKSQKLLLHVMRRSLQPNYLTAGRIYVFSLQSYTAVVQTSVSYFTVLSSFQ